MADAPLRAALIASVVTLAVAAPAHADDGLRLNRFAPAPGYASLGAAEAPPDGRTTRIGWIAEHASRPLTLVPLAGAENEVDIVRAQTSAHVLGDFPLDRRTHFALSLPATLGMDHDEGSGVGSGGAGTGDLLAGLRYRWATLGAFDVGASGWLSAPTASGSNYNGDRSPGARAALTTRAGFGKLDVLGTLGLRVRDRTTLEGIPVNELWFTSAGVRLTLSDTIRVGGTLSFETGAESDAFARIETTYAETMGFVELDFGAVDVMFGGGAGLAEGVGTPASRLLVGVSFELGGKRAPPTRNAPDAADPMHVEKSVDSDGDGLPDPMDRCQFVPEDFDGNMDDDGCPESDVALSATTPGAPATEQHAELSRRLGRIHFATDSADIPDEYMPEIAAVAAYLEAHEGVRLIVRGHTDLRGSNPHNDQLGRARARSVVDALVVMGVSRDRLVATAHADHLPLSESRSRRGMALNRRVDFRVPGRYEPDAGRPPSRPVTPRGDALPYEASRAQKPLEPAPSPILHPPRTTPNVRALVNH